MTVAITLNGDRTVVEEGITLTELLDRLSVAPARVVVEHNRRVIRGAELAAVRVGAGDEIEVLALVGGGA